MEACIGTEMLAPSERSGAGAESPRPGRLHLLVEGWRFLAHSYSIVNHQQCLELLKRSDVKLMHHDMPALPALGNTVHDMMGRDAEDRIESIPEFTQNDYADAVYRIGYPFDFGPSPFGVTLVFATCERGIVKTIDVLTPSETRPGAPPEMSRPFQQRIRDNNITIVTPSEWSKSGFVRSGVDPDRIVVVPHGVDPEVFHPLDADTRKRERQARGQDDLFVFFNVSAMTGNKNPGGVIRAFLEVAAKYPQARLVLKGMNRMYQSKMWIDYELVRLSPQERSLARRTIYYFGEAIAQRDQAMLYQLTDAYVSPYQSEGFNMPVLEAAACGLPVIVSAQGPTSEFVTPDFALPVDGKLGDHHHDGSIWFDASHESLVAQMERAITDHEWRRVANLSGPAHVHANYSWKVVVDKLLAVVRSKVSLKENAI